MTRTTRRLASSALMLAAAVSFGQAQPAPDNNSVDMPKPVTRPVDPYEAVRQGNILLRDGKPAEALELYEQAEREKPDAREIAFAEGLSLYHLGDYERARELFRKADAGKSDSLADDAIYSLGTTYHSDALLSNDDPKAALAQLEQAMEHYQNVLANDPDHTAARDAYRKAGATWRSIKQQMQQQQQQQSSDNQDKNDKEQQENKDQDQQQQQSNEKNEDSNEDQQQSEQNENQDQQQQDQQQNEDQKQQQESEAEKQEQEQEQASASESEEDQEPEDQQQASAEQEQQVSREQAERQLREMMQALRERKERRRQPARLVPVRPVDKDW